LATELIIHEKIVTTEPKAKEARILVEKMITYGKGESLHHRRLALARLPNKKVIEKIFAELAAKYADRSGGYTRILKLGNRKGDAAPMAQVELV
jgi:large subunit ribosomal protein L17